MENQERYLEKLKRNEIKAHFVAWYILLFSIGAITLLFVSTSIIVSVKIALVLFLCVALMGCAASIICFISLWFNRIRYSRGLFYY
ncbi:hypothetical protein COB64_04670 [Candidatus Wolfebacteria bacterium]|nr:MAG: hypothetical protein COB64_04670 [Candidatus Wolfebacteria bacterium]